MGIQSEHQQNLQNQSIRRQQGSHIPCPLTSARTDTCRTIKNKVRVENHPHFDKHTETTNEKRKSDQTRFFQRIECAIFRDGLDRLVVVGLAHPSDQQPGVV
jgi:hypothetical protein